MKIEITETQLWFLELACEAKDKVLPLHPGASQSHAFKSDYGKTKTEVNNAISDLLTQLRGDGNFINFNID